MLTITLCAAQLLNTGCRITSIQKFLGHKKIKTTTISTRACDQAVAVMLVLPQYSGGRSLNRDHYQH